MNNRCGLVLGLAMGPLCFVATAEGMPPLRGSAAIEHLKQEGVYNSLGEALQTAMYGTRPDGRGFAAPNSRHRFVARFSEPGLKIDGLDWQSSWRLRSVGYGERQVAVDPGRVEANGTRVELRHGAGITEWYVNGPRGLEQGFTLQRPPSERRSGDRLRLTMTVSGDLRAQAADDGIELLGTDGRIVLRYEHLVAIDAKGRRLAARMGTSEGAVWLEVEDAEAAWPVTVDPTFVHQAHLQYRTGWLQEPDSLLALSGDTVVAFPSEVQPDGPEVFVRTGSTWSYQASLGDLVWPSGFSILAFAVSGNTVVIGVPHDNNNATGVNPNQTDFSAFNSGAVYVFVRNGNTWSQQAYLKASNTGAQDAFGLRVGVSGDTMVVAAIGEDSNAIGVNGNQNDNSAQDSGAAYVFVRNGVTWTQQAYLKASNTEAKDLFGLSVGVSGDTVVVGTESEASGATGVNGNQSDNSASGSGAVYVFVRNGVTWSQQAYLKASNAEAGDVFGVVAAVSGDIIVVGAPLEDSSARGVNGNQADNGAPASGAAYVFVRNGVTWSQKAYLKASNAEREDGFGSSVAVSGETVVVGAPYEDGFGDDQATNIFYNSGAAYVFVRNGATWSQQDYLKAANTWVWDAFGSVVAVSGDTISVATTSFVFGSGPPGVDIFHDPSVRITDVRSITDFGDVPGFTSGSWLQIKGVNLAEATRVWQASDFEGANAPTSLDGISVLFNGRRGFPSFTKPDDDFGPSQINVQAPGDLGDGPVNVQVLNHLGVSNIFTVQKTALAPGMLAPPKFDVGGKQYLAATYNTDEVFVGNENLVAGAPFRPAKPGDSIWTYGVGFGGVAQNIPPGVIPVGATQLNAQVQFQFGPALVTPTYSGFYPGFIGLDLFVLTVPDVPDGDHQITVLVNGQPLPQTLYLTVKR